MYETALNFGTAWVFDPEAGPARCEVALLLAAAGSLARKKLVPVSAGTFPTHGPLFVTLLVGVVVIVGALTFFPALSLGPIVEHFLMHQGRLWS